MIKKILFYVLLPLFVLGGIYFAWTKQNHKLDLYDLIAEDDLVIVNLPKVAYNYTQWSDHTIFQNFLQLTGISDIKSLYAEVNNQLDLSYNASALVIVKQTGDILLAVEVEEDQSDFFNSNKILEKKINQATWYIKKRGGLVLATTNASLLDVKVNKKVDLKGYNKNQLFFKVDSESLSEKLLLHDDDFFLTIKSFLQNVNHSLLFNDGKLTASAFDLDESKSLNRLLRGQLPTKFGLSKYVLLDFLSVKSLQFLDGEAFITHNKIDTIAASVFNAFAAAEIDFNAGVGQASKIVVVKSDDLTGFKQILTESTLGSLFGFETVKVSDTTFLQTVFGDYFSLTPKYAAFRDDVLILSMDEFSLENYLKKMTRNEVWYYSYDQMKWVENELIYNNAMFVANLSRITQALEKSEVLNKYYNKNKDWFDAVPYLLVQQSKENKGIYEGVSMVYDQTNQPEISSRVVSEQLDQSELDSEALVLAQFESSIMSKPIPVKNYLTGALQFLLVDEDNILRMIDDNGNQQWKFKLDGNLVSRVSEIDVFKNKKTQYIFATDKKLYCVDRLGRMVDNFPILLPQQEKIQGFNLIDYNQSKDYRLAINSKRNIWLFDVTGKSLSGWNPRKFDKDLVGHLMHYRYRTKDYLLAIEQPGIVNLMKRKGVVYDGFPLDLEANILANNVILDKKDQLTQSGFSFISNQGMVTKYGLNGSLQTEEKLPVAGVVDTVFVSSKQSKHRYVATSEQILYVFDAKLSQKLETEITQKLNGFQFYELSGKEVYVFIFEGSTTIMAENGEIILSSLPTKNEISLYYSSKTNSGFVYYTSGDKLMKQVFRLPK